MLLKVFKVGDEVDLLYPQHGCRNILCRVHGPVVAEGEGPGGPYITVKRKKDEMFRTLSVKKIVQLQ